MTPLSRSATRALCRSAIALALFLGVARPAQARVVRLIVDSRTPIANGQPFGAAGAYDRLTGRIFYAFDPANPYDRGIVDLDLAPRNARGEVEAWGEFVMLLAHDPAKRNGVTLVDVANRGGVTVGVFHLGANRAADPTDAAAYGDAFLLREGYTVLTLGWQWDILPSQNGVHFHPPVAGDATHRITGLVRSDITIDAPTRTIPLGHRVGTAQALGYPVFDTTDAANVLTVRDTPAGARRIIPRHEWRFAREDSGHVSFDPRSVYLASGFDAGKIYEVVYRAADPVVTGTGLAAVRDVISYLKHETASIAPTRWGIAYGVSQTGRLLRHLLYQGFNTDEAGRLAYDGIFVHTAGAGRGSFNHRFAQPSRDAQPYSTFFYPTDLFPFTTTAEEDPLTGARGGLRTNMATPGPQPKVFYVDGGYEYWGRAASLTHTSVDGTRDISFLPSERRYVISGAQHSSPASFPPLAGARIGETPAWRGDPLDQRLALRALLADLTQWVTEERTPPPSTYPTIGSGTLVNPAARPMPTIGGVRLTATPYTPRRIDLGTAWARGVIAEEPPRLGAPYAVLVPRADSLGNEMGGIQSVELRAPLATYLPWQLRALPPTDRLVSFQGTFVPLARTAADRRATRDRRPAIDALYPSRDAFLARVDTEASALVKERFLREEDRAATRTRMAETWDWIRAQPAAAPAPTADEQQRTDWANLSRYRTENEALGAPAPGERRVVFYGNSITEAWAPLFPTMFPGKPYIGRGISGQTTPQLLVRFRQDVVALHPSVVVILAGTNDIAGNTGPSTLEMIEDNLASMAEIARVNHIKVVLCSVLPVYDYPWKPGLTPAPKIVALNDWIRRYAAKVGAVYVDYHGAMKDARDGLPPELARDGVHPTEAGYRIMAKLVAAGIARAER